MTRTQGLVEAIGSEQITGLDNTCPAWSADGTRIVFESARAGPDLNFS